MKQQSIASPVVTIGFPAREASPDERCASDRYPSGRPSPFTEPVTGVRGHPGLWLVDLPPRLSSGRNARWLTWQSHPAAGTDP